MDMVDMTNPSWLEGEIRLLWTDTFADSEDIHSSRSQHMRNVYGRGGCVRRSVNLPFANLQSRSLGSWSSFPSALRYATLPIWFLASLVGTSRDKQQYPAALFCANTLQEAVLGSRHALLTVPT